MDPRDWEDPMAETIGESHHEHRNMAKLLDLLEAEPAVYRDGGVADFDLIRDIMDTPRTGPNAPITRRRT